MKNNCLFFFFIFRNSGLFGIVESIGSIAETPIKESVHIKEPIKKITLVDVFENEAKGKKQTPISSLDL